MKQAFKVKLENQSAFRKSCEALIKLGYHYPHSTVPNSATYLYAYSDGHIDAEYIESKDPKVIKIGLDRFNSSDLEVLSVETLLNNLREHEQEENQLYLHLIKQERPLFEANYIEKGGDVEYLRWEECDDGFGTYEPNWEKIVLIKDKTSAEEEDEFDQKVFHQAEHVRACFMSWVECAKSKHIPEDQYLMPLQPCMEMLKKAELEFDGLDIENLQDRIVYSHQAMIGVVRKMQKAV